MSKRIRTETSGANHAVWIASARGGPGIHTAGVGTAGRSPDMVAPRESERVTFGVRKPCRYAFQTWPGLVFTPAMALRVSTMHRAQSASSR